MDYELIIIGAGPAGISIAAEAAKSGIDAQKIIILEKGEAHSWSIRKFYPEQKLVTANYKGNAAVCRGTMCIDDSSKNETLSYLDKKIEEFNLKVSYGENVWKIHKENDIFTVQTNNGEYRSKVCALAIGIMGKPNKPDYKIPASLRDRVTFDITSKPIQGKNVMVVGGGDSASEYAQYLKQEGKAVRFSYRKNEFSRMNDINRESLLALSERNEIEILYGSNITSLEDENGLVKINFAEENYPPLIMDHVVLALGGTTPKNFLTLLGIEFNQEGPILTEGFETSVPGLFLIGDLSAGKRGGSIISAFNSSHQAIQKICDSYLNCTL